jgi:hypothetical protein
VFHLSFGFAFAATLGKTLGAPRPSLQNGNQPAGSCKTTPVNTGGKGHG